MFGKRTAQPKVPKPRDAAQILVTTLVKAYDDPNRATVRKEGMTLTLLAMEAGFVEFIRETDKLDASKTNTYTNDFFLELSPAIKEAELRGWADLDPNNPNDRNNVYVRLLPDGLDYGRGLLRPWWRKLADYFQGDVRAVAVALITTVVTTLVLRLLGWS